MKILLFALLAATVSAGSFKVGDVKCTFGPSYWCHNYKQAKECNAVPYCKEKVWKLKASSNISCTVCEMLVTGFKDKFESPAFQKQILKKVEDACNRFADLAPECKALVDKYEPLLMKSLEKMLADPHTICTELGICSASKEKIMAALLHKALPIKMKAFKAITMKKHAKNLLKAMPVKSSAKCILCEFIADKLDQMLTKNATEKEIKDALDKVCSVLPSAVETECKQFVDEYSTEILQLLSQELSPKMLCSALGLCDSKGQVNKLRSNGEVCEICTTVITFFKNLLQNNSTDFEKQLLDSVKQLCGYLPEQIAGECKTIVSEYGMQVLKLIATSDPKTLCKDIGLCSSKVKLHNVITVKGDCVLGASYWCANHANAVKCNATSFCKKYAW